MLYCTHEKTVIIKLKERIRVVQIEFEEFVEALKISGVCEKKRKQFTIIDIPNGADWHINVCANNKKK